MHFEDTQTVEDATSRYRYINSYKETVMKQIQNTEKGIDTAKDIAADTATDIFTINSYRYNYS